MSSLEKAVRLLRSFTIEGIKGLGHPVSLVGLFGPIFLVANLNWLSVLATADTTRPENVALTRILKDEWVFTLSDYVIQSYTLVLAGVLFISSFAIAFATRYKAEGNFLQKDGWGLFLLVACIGCAVVALWSFGNGVFGSPGVVAKYAPTGTPFWGAKRWPPWDSPITWGRVAIIVLGIGLSAWQRRNNETQS